MELDRIEAFVRRHHVMTLATVGEGSTPWCAHVFYAWLPGCFVFTTDPATRHGTGMLAVATRESERDGVVVAAAIALETRIVGRVQGLQIEGRVRRPDAAGDKALLAAARRAYLKRFPYATFADLHLWVLEPSLMKLTDNTLGFGTKLIWTK